MQCYPITRPVRTTEPTLLQEPVTLAEAKRACNLADANGAFDDGLNARIQAARQQLEIDTGLVCYTGTFTWKLTNFPNDDKFEIRSLRPVTSITSIAYLDGNGDSQTWSASNYTLETSTVAPLVRLTYGNTWPTIRGDVNGITVTLVAGYASVLVVPPAVKLAVLTKIKALWLESMEMMREAEQTHEAYNRQLGRLERRVYP